MARRVLVLGGTGEARRLAALLATGPPATGRPTAGEPPAAEPTAGEPVAGRIPERPNQRRPDQPPAAGEGLDVVYSLAGRVSAPTLPPACRVRTGGFGGPAGLARYLRDERVDAVVDATHPFAAVMTASAARATAEVGVPLLVLLRAGWREQPGDDWRRVPSLAEAVRELERFPAAGAGRTEGSGSDGPRVFLTTGRTDLALFAGLRRPWFLARSVEPPAEPTPPRLTVLLDRGPFDVAGETELLRRHRIDVVVTKDSGGAMVAAKLVAARDLGVPVIMIDRPPLPTGVTAVGTVEDAAAWLTTAR